MAFINELPHRSLALAGLLAGAAASPAHAWAVVHNIGPGAGWVEAGKSPEALKVQRFDGKADWSDSEQFQKGSPVQIRLKAGEKVRMQPWPEGANYFHTFTCVVVPADQVVFARDLGCPDGLDFKYLVINRPGKQDGGPFIEQIKVSPIATSDRIRHELDAKGPTLTVSFPDLEQGADDENR